MASSCDWRNAAECTPLISEMIVLSLPQQQIRVGLFGIPAKSTYRNLLISHLTVNQQPWGADGLALVLQGAGLAANGAGANALGFGNSIPAAWDIQPLSLPLPLNLIPGTIRWRVWQTLRKTMSPSMSTAIWPPRLVLPVSALAAGTDDVTDGLCHRFRVTWQPGVNNLRIFFDGNPVPRINLNYNMVGLVFGGNPLVWWGITGGSGGAAMTQRVCVGSSFAAVGPDATICAGTTLQLNGSGGNTFAWQPPFPILSNTAIPNPVFGPAAVGTYTVSAQVTNAALCTDRDTT
jgi:hypothetical protein